MKRADDDHMTPVFYMHGMFMCARFSLVLSSTIEEYVVNDVVINILSY